MVKISKQEYLSDSKNCKIGFILKWKKLSGTGKDLMILNWRYYYLRFSNISFTFLKSSNRRLSNWIVLIPEETIISI